MIITTEPLVADDTVMEADTMMEAERKALLTCPGDLIRCVRTVIGERPNTIYIPCGCEYATGVCSDETIGCLIGQAIVRFGDDDQRGSLLLADLLNIKALMYKWKWQVFKSPDNKPSWRRLGESVPYERESWNRETTWLMKIQGYQDSHYTWGEALDRADETCPLPKEELYQCL